MTRFARIIFLVCLAAMASSSAFACATCYGASDSPMAQGMNWGIMVLLGFIGAVLTFNGARCMSDRQGPLLCRRTRGNGSDSGTNPRPLHESCAVRRLILCSAIDSHTPNRPG